MPSDRDPLAGTTLTLLPDRPAVLVIEHEPEDADITRARALLGQLVADRSRPALSVEQAYQCLCDAMPNHKVVLALKSAGWRVLAYQNDEDVLLCYKQPTAFVALRAACFSAMANEFAYDFQALKTLADDLEGR